jgi:hypothetical protein
LRVPGMFSVSTVLLLCLCLGTLAQQQHAPQPAPSRHPEPAQPARESSEPLPDGNNVVRIESGDLRFGGSGTVLHLDHFDANSVRRISQEGCKQNTIQIHSGRLSLTDAGLTQLINHGFEKKGDKKRIKVTAEGDKLNFEGSKAAGMPLSFKAKIAPLGGSRIALVATDVKMEHLPVKGLMDAFGVKFDNLMHPTNPALTVEKDNLIVDLRYASKDTPLEGDVTSVAIQGHRIVITFGNNVNRSASHVATVKAAKAESKKSK